MPYEDGDRKWKDTSTSSEISRISHDHKELADKHRIDSPSEPPEGTGWEG